MTDRLGNELQQFDQVLCIDPIEDFITLNVKYRVQGLRSDENRVVILDDTGREGWYKASRFVRVTGESL